MQNTIIYLIGFPGTGKYTIAKEICRQADVRLVDNHLINIPLFSLIKMDGKTPLPKRIWANVEQVWGAVLDTIVHISPREYNFVLTNALTEQGESDRAWFNRVMNAAQQRGGVFVPVRLLCEVAENERRIVMPERAARMKEINPDSPRKNAEHYEVLKTDHPNVLTLDVTALSPEDAARIILGHARSVIASD